MYVHGILHRVEGDIDNARAWYSDVKEQELFKVTWPGMSGFDEVMRFLGRVELKKVNIGKSDEGEERELREESLRELKEVIQFCERKFRTEKVDDTSQIWISMSEKNKNIAEKMITGGEGWRRF